jgi:O-antigen/teichoic acid export membrane protein
MPGESANEGRRASTAVATSMAARALRASGRLAAFWLAARLFPAEEVGAFAYWLAAGSLAAVLGDCGLSEHLMRTLPGQRHTAVRELHAATRLRLVAGTAMAALVWVFAASLGPGGDAGGAGAFLFAAAIGLADFLAACHRAQGRFAREALESGLAAGGGVGAAAVVSFWSPSFTAFEIALGAGTGLVVLARSVPMLVWRGESGAPLELPRRILAETSWLWLKSLLGWSLLDATVILLAFMSDNVQVALFAGAVRLVGLMTQPLIALNWVFTPALAHEAAAGPDRYRDSVRRLNLVGLGAVPAGVAVCVLLGRLALAGFGAGYRAAEPALLLLAVALAFATGALSNVPLVVSGAERQVVIRALCGLVAQVATVVLIAPRHGALGAAFGVFVGLLLAKILTVSIYVRLGLPAVDRTQLALALAIATWFTLVWLAGSAARDLLLLGGGLMSATCVLVLLHRTHIFAAVE